MTDAPDHEPPLITALLSGGKGRRIGQQDKAKLELNGKPLWYWSLVRAPKGATAVIATGPLRPDWLEQAENVIFIEDITQEDEPIGPAGGLLAALEYASTHFGADTRVLTLPVDAPFYPADLSERLSQALQTGHQIAIAESPGGLQPTFGLWTAATSAKLRTRIEAGDRALHRLSAELGAARIWFDDETAFFNINTPGDLEIARQNADLWLQTRS